MLRLITNRGISLFQKRSFTNPPPVMMPPPFYKNGNGNKFDDFCEGYLSLVGIFAICGSGYGAYFSVNDIIKHNKAERNFAEKNDTRPNLLPIDEVIFRVGASTVIGFVTGGIIGILSPIFVPAMFFYYYHNS